MTADRPATESHAGCGDPEHPDGAYCLNTTGLYMCYPPETAQGAALLDCHEEAAVDRPDGTRVCSVCGKFLGHTSAQAAPRAEGGV